MAAIDSELQVKGEKVTGGGEVSIETNAILFLAGARYDNVNGIVTYKDVQYTLSSIKFYTGH